MGLHDVRRMSAHDVEAVVAVYADVLSPAYISFTEIAEGKARNPHELTPQAVEVFERQLRAYLNDDGYACFVTVDDGGAIAGFAIASCRKTEGEHTECWLDDVAVRRDAQSNGFGTALVKAVVQWADSRGARDVLLESGVRNDDAHALFRNAGFEPVSTVFWRSVQ